MRQQGCDELARNIPAHRGAVEKGRAERGPRHAGGPAGCGQAATGRDRQGAVQGRAVADPGRTHRRAVGIGQSGVAGPVAGAEGRGGHVDHHQPQAERGAPRGRHHHRDPRRGDGVDAGCAHRKHHRGPHRARHGGARHVATLSRTGTARGRHADGGSGLERLAPRACDAPDDQGHQLSRARGRGRGHCRADGCGAHRAGDEPVRPQLRAEHQRHGQAERAGGGHVHRGGGDPQRAGLCHRGPQGTGAGAGGHDPTQHHAGQPERRVPFRRDQRGRGNQGGRAVSQGDEHPHAQRVPACHEPVGRQPAKGGSVEMAVCLPPRF